MNSKWIALFFAIALSLTSLPASAFTLVEDDDFKLSMGGMARVGWVLESDSEGRNQEAFVQFARLYGSMENAWGKGYVSGEGASGNFRLLDAYVELRPSQRLHLRAGIYRRPTALEFAVSASKIPFAQRSMLRALTRARLPGAEVISTLPLGTAALNLRLGWFMPEATERALLPGGDGNYISARANLGFEKGFGIHLAYFGLVLADNARIASPDDPTGATLVQPAPHPHTLDFGLHYWTDTWNVQGEVLLSPNDQDASEELNWGAYVHGQYRLPVFNDMELGPGARYGILNNRGVMTQRVTLGATLFLDGHALKFIPNYDLTFAAGEVGHTGWLALHAGF
ncbi:hypothetical protein DL240_16260 [Lujinxingia litoralis]|uniref:Porin n=1 Tax=Lujinxingia litoralis TaxID=2211119 RepID=A0A328C1T6_9DELT|nr:hypothetical protein [Lujinxingia litoralis]RAL20589.1 hypothetical protein DL240_16260 [Lujinxingia litoralis]